MTPSASPWWHKRAWWIGLAGAALFFVGLGSAIWTGRTMAQARDLIQLQEPAALDRFIPTIPTPNCSVVTSATPETPQETEIKRVCLLGLKASELAAKQDNAAKASGIKPSPDERKQIDDAIEATKQQLYEAALDHLDECKVRLVRLGEVPIPVPSVTAGRVADAACLRTLRQAMRFASSELALGSGAQDEPAAAMRRALQWIFGWNVPESGGTAMSLTMPLVGTMAGIGLLLIGLGLGFTRQVLGTLKNENGRYSLSLAQVTAWSVLVLSALVVIGGFNAGLFAEAARHGASIGRETAAYPGFPKIPPEIWAVLGITFASPVFASLILRAKSNSAQGGDDPAGIPGGGLSHTATTGAAAQGPGVPSIADWFLEDPENGKNNVAISRVQVVVVTAALLVVYGYKVFDLVGSYAPATVFGMMEPGRVLLSQLPDTGPTVAALLAFSHGTYLLAKAGPLIAPLKPT